MAKVQASLGLSLVLFTGLLTPPLDLTQKGFSFRLTTEG